MLKIVEANEGIGSAGFPNMWAATEEYGEHYYNQRVKVIGVVKPTCADNLFSILHELGHIHDMNLGSYYSAKNTLQREIFAWRYAYRCIKPKYRAQFLIHALLCIKTYDATISDYEYSRMICG